MSVDDGCVPWWRFLDWKVEQITKEGRVTVSLSFDAYCDAIHPCRGEDMSCPEKKSFDIRLSGNLRNYIVDSVRKLSPKELEELKAAMEDCLLDITHITGGSINFPGHGIITTPPVYMHDCIEDKTNNFYNLFSIEYMIGIAKGYADTVAAKHCVCSTPKSRRTHSGPNPFFNTDGILEGDPERGIDGKEIFPDGRESEKQQMMHVIEAGGLMNYLGLSDDRV
jgi:hypothetical protein